MYEMTEYQGTKNEQHCIGRLDGWWRILSSICVWFGTFAKQVSCHFIAFGAVFVSLLLYFISVIFLLTTAGRQRHVSPQSRGLKHYARVLIRKLLPYEILIMPLTMITTSNFVLFNIRIICVSSSLSFPCCASVLLLLTLVYFGCKCLWLLLLNYKQI